MRRLQPAPPPRQQMCCTVSTACAPAHLVHLLDGPQRAPHHAVALEAAAKPNLRSGRGWCTHVQIKASHGVHALPRYATCQSCRSKCIKQQAAALSPHLPHHVAAAHALHALHKPKGVPHRAAAGVAVPAAVQGRRGRAERCGGCTSAGSQRVHCPAAAGRTPAVGSQTGPSITAQQQLPIKQ